MSEDPEPELTEWEEGARASLEALGLPRWEYKARAATYTQGHRGILDLDLDFPKKYLKGPAVECYVWKTDVEDGTRVHAYADVDGNTFHLQWQTERLSELEDIGGAPVLKKWLLEEFRSLR